MSATTENQINEELRAVLDGQWYCDLNHFGILQLKGTSVATFLQGQLTCDTNQIDDQTASLGACCDHKGRMLATFRLWKWGESFYLLLPQTMIQPTLEHLKKYAVFSKVEVDDVSEIWNITEYVGNDELQNDGNTIVLQITQPKLENSKHQLIVSKSIAQKPEASSIHEPAWRAFNIQNGLATIYPETRGLFTPQMINLQLLDGVSFKKGCYVGQEIVARTEHLGKLKRHLYRGQVASKTGPKPGEAITDSNSQTIGIIVEAAPDLQSNYQFLAVIRDQVLGNAKEVYYQTTPIINITICNK